MNDRLEPQSFAGSGLVGSGVAGPGSVHRIVVLAVLSSPVLLHHSFLLYAYLATLDHPGGLGMQWLIFALLDVVALTIIGEPQVIHRGTETLTSNQCNALWFIFMGTVQWGAVSIGMAMLLRRSKASRSPPPTP